MSDLIPVRLTKRQLRSALAEYRDGIVERVLVGDLHGARVDATGYVFLRDELLNPAEQAALYTAQQWCRERATNRDLEELRRQLGGQVLS